MPWTEQPSGCGLPLARPRPGGSCVGPLRSLNQWLMQDPRTCSGTSSATQDDHHFGYIYGTGYLGRSGETPALLGKCLLGTASGGGIYGREGYSHAGLFQAADEPALQG